MSFGESMRGAQRGSQAPSLAAKLGFQDPDRKDPKHDEIVLWLDGQLSDPAFQRVLTQRAEFDLGELDRLETEAKAWMHTFAEDLFDWHDRFSTAVVNAESDYDRDRLEEALDKINDTLLRMRDWEMGEPPEGPAIRVGELTWEKPVGDPRWIAGFVDLYVEIGFVYSVTAPRNRGGFESEDWHRRVAYSFQSPHLPRWEDWRTTGRYAFEVKTVLPSLGDLIRQIRFYQEKWTGQDPTFYVVSPDTKAISTLQRQGIGFIEYPTGEITHPTGI